MMTYNTVVMQNLVMGYNGTTVPSYGTVLYNCPSGGRSPTIISGACRS